MNYCPEELLPIVADLAFRYCGADSSSVSYEKAEQLLEAIVYCIEEYEREGSAEGNAETEVLSHTDKSEARTAYEQGIALVRRKTKRALALYHRLLHDFEAYGNYYLKQTITKGMPAFFQRYDVKFEPQDTILTLDYPVLKDLTALRGVDAIDAYLRCIALEQIFLHKFDCSYVKGILDAAFQDYQNMVENLCIPVVHHLLSMHILKREPDSAPFMPEDQEKIKTHMTNTPVDTIKQELSTALSEFLGTNDEHSQELFDYLAPAVQDFLVRMR